MDDNTLEQSGYATWPEFIAALNRGCRAAWGAIYSGWVPRWCYIVGRYGWDAEDARALVHEGLVKALDSLTKLHEARSPSPWFWAIIRNHALDEGRRKKVRRTIPLTADVEAPQPADDAADRVNRLMALLVDPGCLSDRDRQLLTARYVRGESSERIAGDMAMTADAVDKAISRARERLRDAYVERYSEAG